ncbi:MAG TPA: PilZ domain-containing protein [Alteraurantiacibacter sp.]
MAPREPRKNLMLAATIEADTVTAPVKIRNMSESGAMIDGPALPEVGSQVILHRLDLSIAATVVWNEAGRCGLKLAGTVKVDEWITGAKQPEKHSSLGQLRVDKIQSAIRSGSPLPAEPAAPPRPTAVSTPVDGRIARELAEVKLALDAIGDELTDDPDILTRHEKALQKLDIASATIEWLAAVVAADDPEAEIAKISMHDLRSRLSGLATLK